MPILRNPKHEKFAQLVVGGMSACQAYMEITGCSVNSGQKNAWRLRENDGVVTRIAELQARNEQKAEMSRAEAVKYLAEVIRSKPSEADEENNLCELAITKQGPVAVFPSKLGAVSQLAKMCGWNEPEKVELGMEAELVAIISKIRGRGKSTQGELTKGGS